MNGGIVVLKAHNPFCVLVASFVYMVGSVVSGKIRPTGLAQYAFDVNDVLGTAFVVTSINGTCITCNHVISESLVESGDELALFALNATFGFSVHPIIKSTILRHPIFDVLKFRVENPIALKQWSFVMSEIELAEDIVVLGFARDHMVSHPGNSVVVPRALKGCVVSAYEHECEIDKPLITTMSGSPVLAHGKVIGIASGNRQYAIDQYIIESVTKEVDGVAVSKEAYEYKETSRFGVFIKASQWLPWAQSSD